MVTLRTLRAFLGASIVSSSLFFGGTSAHALSLTGDTSYSASGSLSIFLLADSGQSYIARATSESFNGVNDSVTLGSVSGGQLSSVDFQASLSFDILKYDRATNTTGVKVGSMSGNVAGDWANLLIDSSKDVAAGRQGSVTAGLLFGAFTGSATGLGDLDFSFPADQKFANVKYGEYGGVYNDVSILTNNSPFSVVLGDVGVGNVDVFKAWYMSAANGVVINGYRFTATGDIHTHLTNPSSVPEPMTVSLLGMGLLGSAVRRKKGLKSA